ncbi:MAG TPA: hypothetical protein VIQ81_10655 [Gammaproteobacteria bacterium]
MPTIPPIRHTPVISRRALRRSESTTATEETDTNNQPSPRDRRRKPDRRQRQLRVRFERRRQMRRGKENTSSDGSVGRHINTEA